MTLEEAYDAGSIPIREFMSQQIDITGNHDDVHLFYEYMDPDAPLPSGFEDVPLRVLLPAYILSELKTAFLMGFQIYLPFLIVDLVVASVTISMGMLMLPPQVVSLAIQAAVVRPGRWLAVGRADVDGQLWNHYLTERESWMLPLRWTCAELH